jgi:inhibitor of KinA sporulation pathway (predicted exonuclease)
VRIVIIDLELNQPSREIIQIGAASVDLVSRKICRVFDEVANPGEPPSAFIADLTGISAEDVNGARPLRDVLHSFWKAFQSSNTSSRIGAWGSDVDWLVEASRKLGVSVPSGLHVWDVKTIVKFFRAAQGQSIRRGVGLAKVAENLSIPFEGRHHNAYSDADMAAKILLHYFDQARTPSKTF